ncbi:hypothetical protein [Sinomicrobium weinanense]|uniref:Calx-beta domain-containing protein n=1 Tax=Sinomicrobium weinanense TaxID=2842200 RepID=A0A926JR34_9FLAO|nr:hypothetical protein [Sinomicrobium weinanense]MBC9795738.1 hypothetical protein [Sinomicrobium weinanense]MBU3125301.1 hypothetical protein [Sinomicrobium weinanense]
MKRKVLITFQLLLLLLLSLSAGGCSDDDEGNDALIEGRFFRWDNDELSADVVLKSEDTITVPLRIRYVGYQVAEPLTAVFEAVESESSAVEGQHFSIQGDITIPANSSHSEEAEVTLFPNAFSEGDSLNIVLRITGAGSAVPMEGYDDFVISISKDPVLPVTTDPVQVRLEQPDSEEGLTMLDVIDGVVYSRAEALSDPDIQARIDFGLLKSSVDGLVMIQPSAAGRLGQFEPGKIINNQWENKNDGVMMKLPEDSNNPDIFEGLTGEENILAAFEEAEKKIGDLGLNSRNYGPGRFIQQIAPGELIFFRSLNRDVYMVALVEDTSDTGGGNDYVDLNIKRMIITAE